MIFMSGIMVGIFLSVTIWAVNEVRTVEHWNR